MEGLKFISRRQSKSDAVAATLPVHPHLASAILGLRHWHFDPDGCAQFRFAQQTAQTGTDSHPTMPRAIISPSVLASDFGQLTAECKRMIKDGAEWLHMGKATVR